MLTKQEIKSSTSDELKKYTLETVKPTIKVWQKELKRISAVLRNRKAMEKKRTEANT